MRIYLLLLFLSISFDTLCQNLVPNPSFEEYSQCPFAPNQVPFAIGWINPTQGSPDYYNACYNGELNSSSVPENACGYQEAKTGVAYCGQHTFNRNSKNLREYFQIKLKEILRQDIRKQYFVGFYCNLRDNYCRTAVNNLGVFFSKDPVSRNDELVIDTLPQMVNKPNNPLTSRTEWMLVADTIQLIEDSLQYITIGNFFLDSLTDTVSVDDGLGEFEAAYYLIDDVFVIDLDSLTSISELKYLTGKAFIHGGQLLIELEESYKPLEIILTNCAGQIVWQHKGFYTQGVKQYNLPLLNEGLYFVEVRCGGGCYGRRLLFMSKQVPMQYQTLDNTIFYTSCTLPELSGYDAGNPGPHSPTFVKVAVEKGVFYANYHHKQIFFIVHFV
ncbi:MAG: hypothetical protein K1X82_10445 [Bacteroidia bacterium]|nr:hypothetical protein [Bacteroidia bacterium]